MPDCPKIGNNKTVIPVPFNQGSHMKQKKKQKKEYSLFDGQGQRKYLNRQERLRFQACAEAFSLEVRLFCLLAHFTGARISEIMNLKVQHIDFSNGTVTIRTLKQRKEGVFRQVPIPGFLLDNLRVYIDNRAAHPRYERDRLWYFSTRTASRYIKAVMHKAGIEGHRATARGLRHGYAVWATFEVSISKAQSWLGHADLKTTLIYTRVSGREDRELAEKMWASG